MKTSVVESVYLTHIEPALPLLQQLGGFILLICCVLGWAAMDPKTPNCYRITYGLIGIGGAALTFYPAFGLHVPEWAVAMSIFGFAMYMVLDRRRIRHTKEPA